VPKIPWRACVNFIPQNQLRLFRLTQSFPPEESAQDSMESLWNFCSKKSTPVFPPHAKLSAKTECPRFQGEPVEILLQKINSGFFATRKVFRQNRVPKISGRACGNPNQPAPPRARSMARMHLLCTTQVNASLLPSRISFLLFR